MARLSDFDKGFRVGVGIALATAQRTHDQASVIGEAIMSMGLTISQYKRAGLEEYDLSVLRYCLRQANAELEWLK